VQTIDSLLHYLVEKGGSDLHILAGLRPAIRLHGELVAVEGSQPLSPSQVQEIVFNALTQTQIEKFEKDPVSRNELDFALGVEGLGRFRFNVHRQRGTVAVVVRALATQIPSLDSLGLPESIWSLCDVKKGLILVTGPTGSGKSTTLAAIVDKLNETRPDHILTIEDPIEYIHNSKRAYVTQREVGDNGDTLTFKNALKYALRQDPDVILIGEMRDYETIGIAVTSAETGHLVFGTLHTSSASQTVGRIIDVFPTDQQPQIVVQLAQNLRGVVSQILLPRSDQPGRAVACEVMKVNAAIRNNIRSSNIDGVYQAIQTGTQDGMFTMDASLIRLVEQGKISYDTARPHIRDEITHRQIQERTGGKRPTPPAPGGNGQGAPAGASDSQARAKLAVPPWEQRR
jgi:twitching motility protein PilT